ncbi:DUF1642 domain-containing protein [Lactococcus lactis subsp. lactis]|uniref:DUF1642 domain-containing protein n=1 Tax=Lactococcus lactis TaxID=1358 RepID=UPI002078FDEF|nr:DUF1642 domain-containing protein [Lactococcus lactis]USI64170.1 DUF1642 domain-containing protein [Lactococcus lactis subsp. lactis]
MNEQKYEVEFLNNDDGRFLLFGGLANYHECFIEQEKNNEGYWQQHFTEQEIKSIDERYWQFAVPVEDGE